MAFCNVQQLVQLLRNRTELEVDEIQLGQELVLLHLCKISHFFDCNLPIILSIKYMN